MYGTHRFDLLSEPFNDLSGIERFILHLNGLCGLYASNWRLWPGFPNAWIGAIWNSNNHSRAETAHTKTFRGYQRTGLAASHFTIHSRMRE